MSTQACTRHPQLAQVSPNRFRKTKWSSLVSNTVFPPSHKGTDKLRGDVRAMRFLSLWSPGQRPDLAIESFQRDHPFPAQENKLSLWGRLDSLILASQILR